MLLRSLYVFFGNDDGKTIHSVFPNHRRTYGWFVRNSEKVRVPNIFDMLTTEYTDIFCIFGH